MKWMKHLMAALLGTALTLGATAHADTLNDIKQRKKILIGIDLSFPPFGLLDSKLQPIGSDVSAAKMLAEDLGVELQIVQLNGPNRVPFLLTNKVDMVISSFSITPERAKVIDFSVPYSVSESVVLSPQKVDIKDISDLAGKHIGVVRGNLQDTLLAPIAPQGTRIVRFDDDASNVVALLSGQVDGIGASKELLPSINKRSPDKNVEVKASIGIIPHGIGIRKGDDALLAWTNEWVKTNLANGRLSKSYEESVGFGLPDMTPFMPK